MEMSGAEGACRGNPLYHNHHLINLLDFTDVPPADIVYICAGVNGALRCEGSPEAYRTNVDGTIRLVRAYSSAFVVWISSSTVEWGNSQYARMKAQVEAVLLNNPNVGIVRAGRVLESNVDDLCTTLLKVGRGRIGHLTLWGAEETYQK
jgi:dTDP-4-dehydrorhamnose reductase